MAIDFQSATKGQLAAYAKEELGLELSQGLRKDEMLARIDEEMAGRAPKPEGRVKIRLARSNDPADGPDVHLSINGRHLVIKRGFDVWVEPMWVAFLMSRMGTIREQDPETLEWSYREVERYPLQILDGQEVLDEFLNPTTEAT